MFQLFRWFAGPYLLQIVVGPACKLLEVLFDLLTPLVIARMIDVAVAARDVDALLRYGALLAGMAVAGICFALVCQKMASLASQGMGTDIRGALFGHVNELSYAELDRFGTPSLITRITNDVNQVQLAVALGIRQLIRWPFLAVGSMVAALLIDVELGTIFLVATPLIGFVFWFVMARCVPYFRQMQQKLDRIGLITREGLSGVRVVRAFVREGHERERFAEAAREQAATAIAAGRLSSTLNPVTFLVMNLAVCAILWRGGLRVEAGDLTQGQVVAFVNYMTQTLLSIVYVANLVVVFTRASASAARVNEVLQCAPGITDGGVAPVDLSFASGSGTACALRLDGATFSYPDAAAPAVEGVSLHLRRGGTLGVIGGTGSGKSTLVSLLPRLYDTTAGSVEVMGVDVRFWPLDQLRRAVSIVPQKAELVSGTIRSNLLWRDPSAGDDELWGALEAAQAAEFVRALPDGLGAHVEAGGANFSGGQRQRLTIARALVGSPEVIVLDDSSSALDFKTDAALRAAVRDLSRTAATRSGMPLTCVIVSQRVSSVRDADQICVMSHGRAVGLGTHAQLVRACGLYREICASQLSEDEMAAEGEGWGDAARPVACPANLKGVERRDA